MGSNEWLVPVLGLGALAVGGYFLLPHLTKAFKDENEYISKEEAEDIAYRAAKGVSDTYQKELGRKRSFTELGDLVDTVRDDDDIYLISDEDFSRLDIGRKDKRFLNKQRKLRDASLERVMYGDDPYRPYIVPSFAGFANTVSPYGQGGANAQELLRIPQFSDQSKVNTRSNTLNLY